MPKTYKSIVLSLNHQQLKDLQNSVSYETGLGVIVLTDKQLCDSHRQVD